ncbi:MAG: class I SAM-dependent DNA methyltransferase [Acidimicrobiales bacterium]
MEDRDEGGAGGAYDRAYFDHWYRAEGFGSPTVLRRKVAFAVAAVEYLLARPLRSVLDVGCGEGPWQPVLADLRPRASYLGIDLSTYAVERYGTRRHLRLGSFAELGRVVPAGEGPFDLVVCVDVLGYVADEDMASGLAAIAERLGGLALLEVFTSEDDFEGDVEHYRRRAPARYLGWFADAGLARIGPNLFVGSSPRPLLSTFESPLGE